MGYTINDDYSLCALISLEYSDGITELRLETRHVKKYSNPTLGTCNGNPLEKSMAHLTQAMVLCCLPAVQTEI